MPRDFERLCLWLVERGGYERAAHLGAAGSEQGRDIVARNHDQRFGRLTEEEVAMVEGQNHSDPRETKVMQVMNLAIEDGQYPVGGV